MAPDANYHDTTESHCRQRRPSATIMLVPDLASPDPADVDGATPLSDFGTPSSPTSSTRSSHHRLPLHYAHSHHLANQPKPRQYQRRSYAHSHHLHNQTSPSLGAHPCEASPPNTFARPPATSISNSSAYAMSRHDSDMSSAAEEGAAGPVPTEGTALIAENDKGNWYHGPLFMTAVKLGILFVCFSGLLLGTLYFGMPNVADEDRPALKIPHSFAELQALNELLHKYKGLYPWRLCLCGFVAYLYVQAFTLPGSMYISILFGAAFGIVPGLILSCLGDSCGSILCYTLSAILAPPLLELPFYRRKLESWRKKIMGDPDKGEEVGWDSVFTVLVVLRIMPLPPHWMANFVAPHLGIGMGMFWLTCFIGIAPVSVIHVTIGSSLDQMSSAEDFHILSVRNVLGLGAVIVAVLIPVGLKRVFRKDLGEFADEEEETALVEGLDNLEDIPAPIPVEFDEHGLPRRYQAVDSGVLLAGPSEGDPAFDLEPETRPPRSQGKSRGVHIIASIEEADSDGPAYELGHTAGNVGPSNGKTRSGFRPLTGYGAIEPVASGEQHAGPSTRWWRFAGN